jgi:hypothetical protein
MIFVQVNYKAGKKHWVLDSGCTQHMTGYVKMFTSLDEDAGDHEQVTFCRCFTGCPPRGIPKVVSLGEETPRSGTRRCKEHKI